MLLKEVAQAPGNSGNDTEAGSGTMTSNGDNSKH